MSNSNIITKNKENIAQEVLSSAEIQAAIQQDLEAINNRLSNTATLQSLESAFGDGSESSELDASKLKPVQITRLQAIEYLLSGIKSDNKGIIANAKSADRQAWMGKHDSDSLDSPWYVTPNNVLQWLLTGPAGAAGGAALAGISAGVALAGGYVAAGAGYFAVDKQTHSMDRTPLPSDRLQREKTVKGRMAIASAVAGASSVISVAGGYFMPAVFNNPQFKIETEMVKPENIEKSIESTTNAVESAKAALAQANPTYKSLVEKRDELSGRLSKEITGIREIEEQLKKGGLSESKVKELNRQRQNYLSHNGTGKFSNQGQLEDYNARIKVIEDGNSTLVKAKFGLSSINELKANIPGAWAKDKDGKLTKIEALKTLAVDQGMAAEAVQPMSEGNLSGAQMEKIAKESFESNTDLASKGITIGLLAIEALVLLGRLGNYKNKRKQMLLTEDFQDGLQQIGEGFAASFQKLLTPRNLPEDRSLWTKADSRTFREFIKNQDILGKVFSSKEFALAVKIEASKKQNNIGLAMNQFEDEYGVENGEKTSKDQNQKKVAGFEASFQNALVANDIVIMREELKRGINRVGIFKPSKDRNGFKRLATNVKRIVTNPFNNLKNGKNKDEIVAKEVLPANSILSVLEALDDTKIKNVLQLKIGKALLSYLKSNPGTNFNNAKVIEISKLTESGLSDEEKQIIESSLEDMNFTEDKKKVSNIKSSFIEKINKATATKDIDKSYIKLMKAISETVNEVSNKIDINNTNSTIVYYHNNLNLIANTQFVAFQDDEVTLYNGTIDLISRINNNYNKDFDIKTDSLYLAIVAKGGNPDDAAIQRLFSAPQAPILPQKTITQLPPVDPSTNLNP